MAGGLAGQQSVGGEQLSITFTVYPFIIIFPFLFCFFKLSLSQPTSFTFYFHPLPHPTLLAVNEWLYAVQLPVGLNRFCLLSRPTYTEDTNTAKKSTVSLSCLGSTNSCQCCDRKWHVFTFECISFRALDSDYCYMVTFLSIVLWFLARYLFFSWSLAAIKIQCVTHLQVQHSFCLYLAFLLWSLDGEPKGLQ